MVILTVEPRSDPGIAVVGCGYWGRNLVRNFHALGALRYINDRDDVTARECASLHATSIASLAQIAEDDAVEGVVIAAPAEQHYELARRFLLARKHVFVEKPLALTITDAEQLCATASEMKRTLMVGHLMQYHPAFQKLKSMVHQKTLGDVQYIYSTRLNLGKFRRAENILWSFAPHDISMILTLFGKDPERVTAEGASYLHEKVADVTTTHLTFPGGGRAHIFVSWLHPFKEQKLVVVGSDRMAVFDDGMPWDSKLRVYPHRIEWESGVPEPTKAEAEPVPVQPAEPLQLECSHFLDCIRTSTQPITDGREGIRVLRVLDAAERSMSSRRGHPDRHRKDGVTIHESAYVDEPCTIDRGTKVWHFSHILPGCVIGRDCVIGQNVCIGPDVIIGDRCKIQNNVSIYKGVTLEDGVFCGPSAVFTNVLTPRAEIERKNEFQSTTVRKGATIGANSTIVCGVELGAYCIVAAGAVVTKDVQPHALVAGVPARQIGWVGHAGEPLDQDLTCPRTHHRYAFVDGELMLETDEQQSNG